MKVSAVVINHNGRDTLLNVVQSLLDQGPLLEELIIVDNGSTDGSAEAAASQYPFVRVVSLAQNRGLTIARNIGLQATRGDKVLFLDDDVYLTKGSLRIMMDAMHETQAAVVCPRILLHPQNETIQCDGAAVHFIGTLALRHPFANEQQHVPQRSIVTGFIGACLLFDGNLMRKLGGFDENYFFYFEDLELSYRLASLGHIICCEERASALHERGMGTPGLSFRGEEPYPVQRAYYTLRHRWLTMLIHFQVRTFLILFPALLLYEAAALIEVIHRGWLPAYLRAVGSLLRNMGQTLDKRRRWGRLRQVSDGRILSGGSLPFSRNFVNQQGIKFIKFLDTLLNFYWEALRRWL